MKFLCSCSRNISTDSYAKKEDIFVSAYVLAVLPLMWSEWKGKSKCGLEVNNASKVHAQYSFI